MSITGRNITRNQATFDYDERKVKLGDNEYIRGVFVNETGAELELLGGEVLARRASGGNKDKFVAFDAANTVAGDAAVVGINLECKTLAIDEEAEILAVNKGKVDSGLLVFINGEGLDTVVAEPIPRLLRDKIAGETGGIDLIENSENTKHDN